MTPAAGMASASSQLAVRAGTTQSAISRIERDRVSPSVETLRELLYLLGRGPRADLRARATSASIVTLNQCQSGLFR